jgi:2'-5' RNA ligase
MNDDETLRLFVALPLGEATHKRLGGVQRKLQRVLPGGAVRWVKPAKIHLTLFFLGDTPRERVDPIAEALSVVTRNVPSFPFRVKGLGAFPNTRRPRVIWVGVEEPTGRLTLLHTAVNEALARVGYEPETRPFTPHLTVGRIRRRTSRSKARLIGQEIDVAKIGLLTEEEARELVLFRSELKPTGAEYTALRTFELGA